MSEPMIHEVLEEEKNFMENPELRSEYEYREEELRTYRTDMEESRKEGKADVNNDGRRKDKAVITAKRGNALDAIRAT